MRWKVVTKGIRNDKNGADKRFKWINIKKKREYWSNDKKREEGNYTKKKKTIE